MFPIPITIITGFLGSGKTTLILNLLPQLPPTYRLALLKNEFGDLAIDSQLASSAAVSGVQELLNGCICCNLVGQLGDALDTLRTDVRPDRIVIETSGSAFPATLAMEVNRLARETGHYVLDGVVAVVDVENWRGYEDTSPTARMQARYTDLIVLNKWEGVGERALDDCYDRLGAIETETATVKSEMGRVPVDVVFGLDGKLAREGASLGGERRHEHGHQSEVEVLSVTMVGGDSEKGVDLDKLMMMLEDAPKDEVYRIKAVLYASGSPTSSNGEKAPVSTVKEPSRYILNWAFGRWTFTPAGVESALTTPVDSERATPSASGSSTPSLAQRGDEPTLRMTIVTARYESNKWKKSIEGGEYIALADGANGRNLSVERIS